MINTQGKKYIHIQTKEIFVTMTEAKHFNKLWYNKFGNRLKEDAERIHDRCTVDYFLGVFKAKARAAIKVHRLRKEKLKYDKELRVRAAEKEEFIQRECIAVTSQIESFENQIEKLKLGINLCYSSLKHHRKEAAIKYKTVAKPWENAKAYKNLQNKINKYKKEMQ